MALKVVDYVHLVYILCTIVHISDT